MSDLTEVFVDGLNQIHLTGELVRFDFMTLQSSGPDPEKKTRLRMIMHPQNAIQLRDTLTTLIQRMQEARQQSVQQPLEVRYNPSVFSVPDIDAAKRIILTKESETGTEERWQKETPALMNMLTKAWQLGEGVTVVDYGCGIGRISKELCGLGCRVVGVDISPEMRKLAVQYVCSEKFTVVSPEEFVGMIGKGFRCDYACAIWVLQHCLKPHEDLGRIISAMKNGGELFVVNNKYSRAVPVVDKYWENDGIDIWQMCNNSSLLCELRQLGFPQDVGLNAEHFMCGFYQRI